MKKTLRRLAWTFLASMCIAPLAHAGSDVICDKLVPGTFWDSSKDGCYKCPRGYTHNPKATYDTGACRKRDEREGVYQRRDDKLQAGPFCTGGAWVSFHRKDYPAGVCMKCPEPPADKYRGKERVVWSPGDGSYTHDHSKKGNEAGVCWRDVLTVPDVYAVNVVGDKLLKLCEATLMVFAPGKKFPSPVQMVKDAMPEGVSRRELIEAVEKYKSNLPRGHRQALDKMAALSSQFEKVGKELFSADGLCDSSSVLAKLQRLGLVPRDWNRNHYVAFSTTFDAGLGVNAMGGYMVVTNFDKVTKIVGLLGAPIGFKAGAGGTLGMQFFPDVDDFDEFLGPGLGASVSVDLFGTGPGVDASFTFTKKGKVELQGIGPSIGVGASPVPGSAVVTGTYSWDMSKVKNY